MLNISVLVGSSLNGSLIGQVEVLHHVVIDGHVHLRTAVRSFLVGYWRVNAVTISKWRSNRSRGAGHKLAEVYEERIVAHMVARLTRIQLSQAQIILAAAHLCSHRVDHEFVLRVHGCIDRTCHEAGHIWIGREVVAVDVAVHRVAASLVARFVEVVALGRTELRQLHSTKPAYHRLEYAFLVVAVVGIIIIHHGEVILLIEQRQSFLTSACRLCHRLFRQSEQMLISTAVLWHVDDAPEFAVQHLVEQHVSILYPILFTTILLA